MPALLDTLWNEHRSIAAILHGLLFLVREKRERGKPLNADALRAMLYYLDVFPERVHHPKEERLLFAAVRRRTSDADAMLDALEREHETGQDAIRRLEQALLRYEEGGEPEFDALTQTVEQFVADYRDHMRKEEDVVMDVARRVLTSQDWAELRGEWAQHRDPLAGLEDERDYDRLIARVVDIAPPPIGLGPGA